MKRPFVRKALELAGGSIVDVIKREEPPISEEAPDDSNAGAPDEP